MANLHPCPNLQPHLDWAHLSRSNPPAHLIGCIESSGICRFHKSAGIRVFPCVVSAIGRPAITSAVGTHSRFTSQTQSYAQSQIVARETFAWEPWVKRVAGSAPSRELCDKVQGPLPGEGAAPTQWPVKGLLEMACLRKQDQKPGYCTYGGCTSSRSGRCVSRSDHAPDYAAKSCPEPRVPEGTAALNQKRTSAYDGTKCNWNAKGTLANCPKSTRSSFFCVELFPKNRRVPMANSTIRKVEV